MKSTSVMHYCAALFSLSMIFTAGSHCLAQTISMNFSLWDGSDPNNPITVSLAPTDVAGVVAASNWNDLPTTFGSANNLVNSAGAATSADITWTTGNVWGGWDISQAITPDERMMFAWIDDSSSLGVTVSEIPYSVYDVYIYGTTDDGNDSTYINTGKTIRWNVNGSDEVGVGTFVDPSSPSGDYFTGTHVDGRTGDFNPSYMKVSGLVGDLSISGYENSSASRSAISGIQIVPAVNEGRLRLNIDRDTGQVNLVNNTGSSVSFSGVTLRSNAAALDPNGWTSITDNYDQGDPNGISADAWLKFVESSIELSEASLGVGSLNDSQSLDLGAAWGKFPVEDVTMEYLDSNGNTVTGAVVVSGTLATEPYEFGDYDFNGTINALDWQVQKTNYRANLDGLSTTQAYSLGDFDLDGDNDLDDLRAFKTAFQLANPLIELSSLPVPEPAAIVLAGLCLALTSSRRWGRKSLISILLVFSLFAFPEQLPAATGPISINFSAFYDPGGGPSNDLDFALDPNDVAGVIPASNWNDLQTNFDDATVGSASGLVDSLGATTTADISYTASNLWGGFWNSVPTDPDERMMDVWLDDGPGLNVSVTNIPWFQYDVYVLATSDDEGKALRWDVNGNDVTTAGVTAGPGNANGDYFFGYVDGSTGADNPTYMKFEGLTGPLNIGGFGNTATTRSPISGLQIVESTLPLTVLTLEINSDTGVGKLKNTTTDPVALDFYEIASDPSSSLTHATWNSIEDNGQNGLPQGDGSGNGWEELGGLGNNLLAEFYLDDSSTLAPGESLSLGAIFNTSTGIEEDISFIYNDPNAAEKVGKVSFVTGLAGDFDGSGTVDGLDFLLWQRNPSIGLLSDWEDNYGMSDTLSATFSTVPEPSTLLLFSLGAAVLGLGTGRNRNWRISMNGGSSAIQSLILSLVAGCLLQATASAGVTNDRLYSFGEDPFELVSGGNSNGAIIGSDNDPNIPAGLTLDSTGPSGAFLDLAQTGDPTYRNVGTGPVSRPGAAGGEYGAQFDGIDDILAGVPLNRPDEMAGPDAVGDGPLLSGYPFNYNRLTGRGLQLWVYPEDTALGSSFQSIVADTIVSGGPAIDAAGNWTQINNWQTPDPNSDFGPLSGTVPVVGDTWHHVMHHNHPILGNQHKSVLYVNGVAVSANISEITAGVAGCDSGVETCDNQLEGYVGQLVVGATEVKNDGVTPAYGFHFTGILDDMEMYVFGDNTSFGGQDYGSFDLFDDNEWILDEIVSTVPGNILIPGDVNKDGAVNGDGTGDPNSDDVSAFVAGWGSEHTVDGVQVGDWTTWDNGDLDHNGVTDFDDWFLLLSNHPSPLSLNLTDLLAANVPEPSSLLLLTLGATSLVFRRGREAT